MRKGPIIMSRHCGGGATPADIPQGADPCCPLAPDCRGAAAPGAAGASDGAGPLEWFEQMIPHCLDHARQAKDQGRPIVGIMCEFTPRELILAAGGVPVCLCGGSAETIPSAEEILPANLCPLIKSTFGYLVDRSNPFLEMADLVVAETTCDGKKKMYELMGEQVPMAVLELPQKPDDPDALAHWTRELRKLRSTLEQRFETVITDERLREAMAVMNRERALRRALAGLMRSDAPPLTGLQLLSLKSSISGLPEDFAQYEKALEMFGAQGGPAAGRRRRPRARVLLTGVPLPHGAERPLRIIEECGGLVVAMENCTGLKPLMRDGDVDAADPIAALADLYFHLPCSVMTSNDARLDLIGRLVEEYRADCVIDLVWQACLTYDVESWRVRRYVEETLGKPYLRIETDYSPSDSARIVVRVEALFETLAAGATPGVAAVAGTAQSQNDREQERS